MKRAIVATLTAVTVFGGVYGFATTANIGSSAMGAGGAVVQSCQSEEMTSSYGTSWSTTDKAYRVTSITVGGITEGCDDHAIGVALTGGSGASTTSLFETTGSTGTAGTVVFDTTSTGPLAASVTGVQVVVSN